MRTARKFRWWGLYALVPLMIGLMVLADVVPMTETGPLVLLAAIVLVTCGLALAWIGRNARLVETDGLFGISTYRVLLDTGAGPSAEPLVREVHQTREKMPAVECNTAVCSPTSQMMAEGARSLS